MLKSHIETVIGDGIIKQDVADAALEIVHAKTDAQLMAAAKRYQNFVLIAARGLQINWPTEAEAAAQRDAFGGCA